MIYRIITTTGVELGYVEDVNYIMIHPRNKCFNSCKKEKAIGIAFKGKPYNLVGHADIPGAETVMIQHADVGDKLVELNKKNTELTELLAEADEAAIELYEMSLTKEIAEAEQDEAIIQIYEMMGELTNG